MADPVTAALLRESGSAPAEAAPGPVAAPQPASNDPITAALLGEAKGASKAVPDSDEDYFRSLSAAKPKSMLERAVARVPGIAAADAALAVGTGIIGGVAGAAAGLARGLKGGELGTAEGGREASARAAEIAASLTYQPRTEMAQGALDTIGKIAGATKLAGLGPSEAITLGGLAAGPRAAARAAPAAETAAQAVPGKMASVGAAGVAPAEQARTLVANASPELRAAVEKSASKMTPAGLKTLERHLDADTLPIPMKLTTGMATQDATLISNERNARGASKPHADKFGELNTQLKENIDAIREKVAPDVYVSSKPELGELIIDAYKAKDASLNGGISAKYQALRDANGGAFPLDAKAFVSSADAALHKDLLYDHLPSTIRSTMDRVAKEGMTFENFESLRTNLARMQRSQTIDGNAKAAASTVRDALEALPLPAEAAHLKPLADAARAAARERFALIEADPAYKAVTRGKASADKFVEKYVIGADKKNVETMHGNLSHDSTAQQAMAAGAIQRLKDGANIRGGDQGNFGQAGYNRNLESMRPKLSILLGQEGGADAEKLGRVANYVNGQPTGSFVNNSNTAVALMGSAAKYGVTAGLDMAIPGLQTGTRLRQVGKFAKEKYETSKALNPYGGMTLKEITK